MSVEKSKGLQGRRCRDRRPDPNVGQTILSVKAQRDFKRMLVFGLRSLSDLCSISNRQYVDNSYTCIEEDLMMEFDQILIRHDNDVEILGLVSKIVTGMSRSFCTEPDDAMKNLAVEQGLANVVTQLLVQSLLVHAPAMTWDQMHSICGDLIKTGVSVCTELGLKECQKALEGNQLNAKQGLCILGYVQGGLRSVALTSKDKAAEVLVSECVTDLLEAAQRVSLRTHSDKLSLQFALEATEMLTKVPPTFENEERAIKAIIGLMDLYHTSNKYTQLGSNALASLIGVKKLQDVLGKLSRGGSESMAALGLLTALSYVPSFATDWASQGGNKPLVDVIKGTLAKLDLSDTTQMNALKGAAQMLNTIAADGKEYAVDLKKLGAGDCMIDLIGRVGNKSSAKLMIEHDGVLCAAMKALCTMLEGDEELSCKLVSNKSALSVCVEAVDSGNQRGEAAIKLLGEAVNAAPTCRQELLQNKVDAKVLKAVESQEGLAGGSCFRLLSGMISDDLSASSTGLNTESWSSGLLKGIRCLSCDDIKGGEAAIELITKLNSAPAVPKKTKESLTEGVLDLCLKFSASSATMTHQCTKLLALTASESDLVKAVNSVVKLSSSPKGNVDELMNNYATINGLVNIDRLRDSLKGLKVEESLIKSANHILMVTPFVKQQNLLEASFDCLATTQKVIPTDTGAYGHKMVGIALSAGMKSAVQFESSADSNSLISLLKALKIVLAGDNYETTNDSSAVHILEGIGSIMRKYPDSRKVLSLCLELINILLESKSVDISKDFIKIGTAKQVVSLLQKAAMHEDLQRYGLKSLLLSVQKNNENADPLRSSGAMEVVRAASRGYSNKSDIMKTCLALTRLLTPVEEARREVNEQIGHLNTASRNRDMMTGRKALGALCDLTTAADAAKHAARNGVGDAVNAFFESMNNCAATATSSQEKEVCSKDAVGIMKNVASVGRPHSSLLLKNGALSLLKAIAEEAYKTRDTELGNEVFKSALDAGRTLLAMERNPLYAQGAMEFNKYLMEIIPEIVSRENNEDSTSSAVIPTIISTMGLLLATSQTLKDPNFQMGIKEMVATLHRASNAEQRLYALDCISQMFSSSNLESSVGKDLAKMFADYGGCEALLKVVDVYSMEEPSNAEIACATLERITSISGDQGALLRKAIAKNPNALHKACKAFGRNLGTCRDDSVAVVSTLHLLTAMTTRMDRADIEQTGLLEVVQHVMEIHPDSKKLQLAVGDFLVNVGAEDWITKLFARVVELLTPSTSSTAAVDVELLEILKKLEVFIPCSTEKIEECYQSAPAAMRLLARYLENKKNDSEVLCSVALVARRLCQRFENDVRSPFGAKAMLPDMMEALILLIGKKDSSNIVRKTRDFMRDSYEILDALCVNGETFSMLKQRVLEAGFLKCTWELFERYCKDQQVAEAIIRFMGHFATDEQCVRELENSRQECGGAVREMGSDVQSTIMNCVWGLRRSPDLVNEGFEAIGNIIRNGKGVGSSANAVRILEDDKFAKLADASVEGATGYASMLQKLMSTIEDENADTLLDSALDLIIKKWNEVKEDKDVKDDLKQDLLRELAGVADAFALKGRYNEVKKHRITSLFSEAMKQLPPRKDVVNAIIIATAAISDNNELRDGVVTKTIPALVSECTQIIQRDVKAADNALSLILKLISNDEESCNFMREVNGLRETLEGVQLLSNEQSDSGVQMHLQSLINEIKRLLNQSQPGKLTLEEINRRWLLRKEDGELIDLNDNEVLIKEFLFNVNKMKDLCANRALENHETIGTSNGREFSFGCLNFDILHEYYDNLDKCLMGDASEGGTASADFQLSDQVWAPPNYFISAMERLHDNELIQYIIMGTLKAVNYKYGGEVYGKVKGSNKIVCEMVRQGSEWKGLPVNKKQGFLLKRLEYMEKICYERHYYDGTDALDILNKIWDEVDEKMYSIQILIQVVKVLRAMINDNWTEELIKMRVAERLLERIECLESPHELLSNVLFCVGTMAAVPKLKNIIGELEGIEKITELLKRCEKQQAKQQSSKIEISRTQQNACLTLGNLVLSHGPNGNAFGNCRGPDLAIRIMRSSMTNRIDYDLANSASILMCNLSFKRDDFKEFLGSRGAAEAILLSIHQYDGLQSESAYRCLTSMFKAITNLSLIPTNVQRFLDAGISESLQMFYGKATDMPDELIHCSLRTLSNLTLENSESFMKEFGSLMIALLNLLEEKPRTDSDMLSFLFETFASLCRLQENRDVFINNRGVEVVTGYLNSVKHERVYEEGLGMFAVLAHNPDAVERMVNCGFCNFVLGILDDCEDLSAELVIGALKVLRRLVQTPMAAKVFVQASPMPLLTDVLCAAASEANTDTISACIATETLRIVLHLLHLHPAPCGSERDENLVVITEPEWKADFEHASDRTKSFSRLFKSGRQKGGDVDIDDGDDEENKDGDKLSAKSDDLKRSRGGLMKMNAGGNSASAAASLNSDDDGSPVALDSPLNNASGSTINDGNALLLYKPRGVRAYENIGLDSRGSVCIARALFLMLVEQETVALKLDKLTRFAMVYLAYVTAEKVDGVQQAFTEEQSDLGTLVTKTYGKTKEQKCEMKLQLVFEGTDFLTNTLCLITNEDIKALSVNEAAMKSMKSCISALHPKKEVVLRRKIEEIYALLSSPTELLNVQLFYPLTTYETSFDAEEFTADKYPNGVQDLPSQIRSKIRRGGKCLIAVEEDAGKVTLANFYWKSSTDLQSIKYMYNKKRENYDFEIPLPRIRKIERGAGNTQMFKQHPKMFKSRNNCMVALTISPCPQYPSGTEMLLAFPTRFHSKKFHTRVFEWHVAATV